MSLPKLTFFFHYIFFIISRSQHLIEASKSNIRKRRTSKSTVTVASDRVRVMTSPEVEEMEDEGDEEEENEGDDCGFDEPDEGIELL